MLLECALLQECRDEYYTVHSLNALFETIPETFIVEFLREAGFFYLIWCSLISSVSPQTFTIWSDLSNYLENESNSETFTCVGSLQWLICPEGRVSSLNKSNPTDTPKCWMLGTEWIEPIFSKSGNIIFMIFGQQGYKLVETWKWIWVERLTHKLI